MLLTLDNQITGNIHTIEISLELTVRMRLLRKNKFMIV